MKYRLLAVLAIAMTMLSGCGYNQIQINDEAVNGAWSEVLNQYKRRADLTAFSSEKTILFVAGSTYPASTSFDLPLAGMYQGARTLRIADGPDEVHKILIAKNILTKYHRGESWDFGN